MTQVVTTPDGVTHQFPDEATPQMMAGALKQHGYKLNMGMSVSSPDMPQSSPAPMFGGGASGGKGGGGTWGAQFPGAGTARFLVNGLPLATGIAGEVGGAALGALGGPAAPATIPAGKIAGGAAGGAVGQVARNAIAGGPVGAALGMSMPGSLTEGAGREAAIQGAGSAIGIPVGGATKFLGGALTGNGLRRAGQEAADIASNSAATITRNDLLAGFGKLSREAQLMGEKQVKRLQKFTDSFLGQNPNAPMTAEEVHTLRVAADNAANAVHNAVKAGQQVGPKQAAEGRYWKQVADTARGWLKDNVPEYSGAMGRSRRAIFARGLIPRVAEGPIRPNAANLFGASDVAGRLFAQPAMHAAGSVLESPVPAELPRLLMFLAAQQDATKNDQGGSTR